MFEKVTVKVPGKLFIAGEYAVTRPGCCAMVAAIENNFIVTVAECQSLSHLKTNVALDDMTFDIHAFEIQDNGWNFAMCALDYLLKGEQKYLGEKLPQLELSIESGLGFGDNKKGYGSSACVVVGVVKAVSQFLQLNLTAGKIFEYAAKAHCQVQGSGSMGDVASIATGGLIFYQSPDKNWKNWMIVPQEWSRNGWQTYLVSTDKSVKTSEKLKISLSEEFYYKSDKIVRKIAQLGLGLAYSSKKFKALKTLVLRNQQLLIEHLPAAYLTEKLAYALKIINQEENMVGKISGSGFGENMIVFTKNEKGIKKVREKLARHGIGFEKIRISEEFK